MVAPTVFTSALRKNERTSEPFFLCILSPPCFLRRYMVWRRVVTVATVLSDACCFLLSSPPEQTRVVEKDDDEGTVEDDNE
jgi:hypothetical protein